MNTPAKGDRVQTHPIEINGRTHRHVGRVISARDDDHIRVLFHGHHRISTMRACELENAA